jgi:hypothetical protein
MTHEPLYDAVVRLGIDHDHREGDLYLPDSRAVRALLADYGIAVNSHTATRFRDNVTGGMWIDVPFMYRPFWTQTRISRRRTANSADHTGGPAAL